MQSPQFLLSNSSTVDAVSVRICCPNVHLNQSHSHKSIITCAKSSNKGLFRSQRSKKALNQLLRFAASNLHYVLPAPFNSVARELGGGGGGGSGGSWKGFGWGGFDGGGRKRRVNNNKSQLWFWRFATVCCLGFWGLRELELKKDVMLGALCLLFLMFAVLVGNGCVCEWVLGFCSGGGVVGMWLYKKDELVKGFRATGISRRRRRGRRAS